MLYVETSGQVYILFFLLYGNTFYRFPKETVSLILMRTQQDVETYQDRSALRRLPM